MVLVELVTSSSISNFFGQSELFQNASMHQYNYTPKPNKCFSARKRSINSFRHLAEACAIVCIQKQWRKCLSNKCKLLFDKDLDRDPIKIMSKQNSNTCIQEAIIIIQSIWRRCLILKNLAKCKMNEENSIRHISNTPVYHLISKDPIHYSFTNENINKSNPSQKVENLPFYREQIEDSEISQVMHTENPTVYPNGVDRLSTREEVVHLAHKKSQKEWKFQPIELEDIEVAKFLEALKLLDKGEASKALNSIPKKNKDSLRYYSEIKRSKIAIPLGSSSRELAIAIGDAVDRMEFNKRKVRHSTSRKSKIETSPKKKCVSTRIAKTAKKYLLELMRMPENFLSFLIDHDNIQNYSQNQLSILLRLIGVNEKVISEYLCEKKLNVLKVFSDFGEKMKNSFLRRRIVIAKDIIQFIIHWETNVEKEKKELIEAENTGPLGSVVDELRASIIKLRNDIQTKDEKIFSLTEELSRLIHSTENYDGRDPKHSDVECRKYNFVEDRIQVNSMYNPYTGKDFYNATQYDKEKENEVSNPEKKPDYSYMTNVPFSMSVQFRTKKCSNSIVESISQCDEKLNSTLRPMSRGNVSKERMKVNTIKIAFQEENKERVKKQGKKKYESPFKLKNRKQSHTNSVPYNMGTRERQSRIPDNSSHMEKSNQGHTYTTSSNRTSQNLYGRKNAWMNNSKSVKHQYRTSYNKVKKDPIRDHVWHHKKKKEDFPIESFDSITNSRSLDAKLEERLEKLNQKTSSSEAKLNDLLERLRMKSMEKYTRSVEDIEKDTRQRQNIRSLYMENIKDQLSSEIT